MANNKKRPPSSGGQQKFSKKRKPSSGRKPKGQINSKLIREVMNRSHGIEKGVLGNIPKRASILGDRVLTSVGYLCTALSLALYCITKALDADFYEKVLAYIYPDGPNNSPNVPSPPEEEL